MLKDLAEVQRYTERLANAAPELARELVFRPVDVSDDALVRLAEEVRLPPIYQTCATHWGLYGVSLGYFALWPSFDRRADLVASLRQANLNTDAIAAAAASRNLVIVAREEANRIGVGNAASDRPDTVYYISTMASPEWTLAEIADSFEKFILMAANLHKISYLDSPGINAGSLEMARFCELIGCSKDQSAFWERKAAELAV